MLYARTGALPAIAAALALSSTQAPAQEAAQQTQPATSQLTPATTEQPATTETAPAADTSATAPATSATRSTRAVKRTSHATAARPAPVVTHAARRTATTQRTASATTAAAAPKPAAAPLPAPQSAVKPVVNYQPKPAPSQTSAAPAKLPNLNGEALPIAGGALALLAIGGAAAAVTARRRRRREQEWADAQTLSYEPFEEVSAAPQPEIREEQAAVAAPAASAFAWGDRSNKSASNESAAKEDDRRPGETWVERAYRGPTPNNPSVSLRNRLKRAAFFDKREREAAAGLAEPVSGNAGLPGAMAGERELA